MQNTIGLISDIHGNSLALKAVLTRAAELKISKFIFLGDIVGYYYEPNECLKMLADLDVIYIRGNHEVMLKDLVHGTIQKKSISKKYGHGLELAAAQLTSDQIDFLINLPDIKSIELGSKNFLLCHGAPWDENEYLYPNCPKSTLERCNSKNVDFLLCGHTHYPMEKVLSHTTVINPGSVGQPRDRHPGAAWATLDLNTSQLTHHREPYNLKKLLSQIDRYDPSSNYHKEVLTRQ